MNRWVEGILFWFVALATMALVTYSFGSIPIPQ